MADRYWVGGTGSWSNSNTANWSTINGGTGGASVPNSTDDVFFTSLSGGGTCTILGGASQGGSCKNATFTGYTGTLATASSGLLPAGDVVLGAGMTMSGAQGIVFSGSAGVTQNITSNGCVVAGVSSGGSYSGTISMQDALTVTNAVTMSNGGNFVTNNYNLTCLTLNSTVSVTRSISLGSSSVTITGSASSQINFSGSNFTFNAGTSTINLTNALTSSGTLTLGGYTFYNFSISGAPSGTNTLLSISGANTFNDLTIAGPSVAGQRRVSFAATQIVNGVFSTTATAGNKRVIIQSGVSNVSFDLEINGSTSLTDVDFRNVYVTGTASPISGTRIGDQCGNSGITFSTPKTVYWNLAGAQNWNANGWAQADGGAPSTDYYPLPQDTAKFTNTGSVTGTITIPATISVMSGIDMSTRSSAMTLSLSQGVDCFGNWSNGSGTTLSGAQTITFRNESVKTINSAGKTFSGGIGVAAFGGGLSLSSALTMASGSNLSVSAGSFATNNYALTTASITGNAVYPNSISLGSSAVSLSSSSTALNVDNTYVSTFNAGTSTITLSSGSSCQLACNSTSSSPLSPIVLNNVIVSASSSGTSATFNGKFVFNNLTINPPSLSAFGGKQVVFRRNAGDTYTINGTLDVSSATPYIRNWLRTSDGGQVTLTVNSLVATNADFSNINLAGSAAGASPTRAGDCGNNTGINFPAPKTVYRINSGSGNWGSNSWSNSSGGGANTIYYPLAQDTAVIDNNSGSGINFNFAYVTVGTISSALRTTAFTFSVGSGFNVYGNVTFGTGISIAAVSYQMIFSKYYGTQTLITNGISVGCGISVDNNATLQLGDALTATGNNSATAFNPSTNGTFDANNYNVTATNFSMSTTTAIVKMGSGTWTATGTGSVWTGGCNLDIGTSNIVLSNTSTTARTFAGGSKVYPKLTIGGATGISTLTITGNNSFTELAATKTVAHTIALGTTQQSFGKWSVTGTVGNVVTVTGTPTIYIMGASTSGVNYLAMGTATLATNSPGAFYAGVNSTGSGSGITLTDAPAPRTLYWVGGTGNWNDTAHWSTASGGASGAAVPTSFDAVNFDSASNGTTYTVTVDAASLRCGAFNMAAPATGTVTLARSNILSVHGSFTLAATGVAMSIGNPIYFSGSSANTLTTNGVDISTGGASACFYASGGSWTLGSDLNVQSGYFALYFGTFDTANYNVSCGILKCQEIVSPSGVTWGVKTLNLGSSTITVISSVQAYSHNGLTLNAGTSTFTGMSSSFTLETNLGGFTFYNLNVPNTCTRFAFTNGSNTFNNVTFANPASAGLIPVRVYANQTISGTLTTTAGSTAIGRTFIYGSDSSGLPDYATTKTLTCAATNLTDTDFSAIVIAGAAAPASGTRLGNVGGNSGITFPAPKTVYYRGSGSSDWNANSWSATDGGSLDVTQYPLAQDTAVIPSGYPISGSTITFNVSCNIGTLDASARTSNTVVLASTGSNYLYIMGDVNCGSETSFTGTFLTIYAGRTTQNITTSGVTYPGMYQIKSPGGTIVLQDNISLSSGNAIYAGGFNANNKNVTLAAAFNASQATMAHTINIGSGTWTFNGATTVWNVNATYTTIAGTGTLRFTSSSAKSFVATACDYSGVTIDQAGSGDLTFSGVGAKVKNVIRSYSGSGGGFIFTANHATTISDWNANGDSLNTLQINSSSVSSPTIINYIGSPDLTLQYVTPSSVIFFPITSPAKWTAQGSVNNGSLGMLFAAAPPPVTGNSGFFFMMGC